MSFALVPAQERAKAQWARGQNPRGKVRAPRSTAPPTRADWGRGPRLATPPSRSWGLSQVKEGERRLRCPPCAPAPCPLHPRPARCAPPPAWAPPFLTSQRSPFAETTPGRLVVWSPKSGGESRRVSWGVQRRVGSRLRRHTRQNPEKGSFLGAGRLAVCPPHPSGRSRT